ncbi:hypothetical protein [Priestia megaterium]|uniref:Uncharacterized protein n=1 Tax=Priestia megaterium TaxID=1404 RepID=A0A6M6E1C6_PRIMG|nr:hypothetical protein [Priestia megaterium]QJX80742.1 hypothetical protein FDZ14_32140 [Priestia megaterium]
MKKQGEIFLPNSNDSGKEAQRFKRIETMVSWRDELEFKLKSYTDDLPKVRRSETKHLLINEIKELKLFITAANEEINRVKSFQED